MRFDKVRFGTLQTKENDTLYKFGLKFMRNHYTCILYCSDITIYESFKKQCNLSCILNTFDDDYHVEKLIGKGSFGKVDIYIDLLN